jgi:phosphoglycerate dehydrogenase-like enzyme
LGNIGREVARLLQSFACELYYYDAVRAPAEIEKALNVRYTDLDRLIEQSDVVTLHAPATLETTHLINEQRLRAMKPTAVLINCSRGELVDEMALARVMQSGHLLGAGLDVFETEPLQANHPLTKLENVALTPHIAGGTSEAMEAAVKDASENIRCMLTNGTVANEKNIVNWNDVKGRMTAIPAP